MSEQVSIKELRAFQQVFGREGARTPAQVMVMRCLRKGLQYDEMTFQPQTTLICGADGAPLPSAVRYDPIAAAITDGMRRGFIFIRDRVDADYQVTGAE